MRTNGAAILLVGIVLAACGTGTPSVTAADADHIAPTPSESRLREVAAHAAPPMNISEVASFAAGPVTLPGPDEQKRGCCARPWGAPGRTSQGEVGNGRTEDAVHITWTAVSPALADAEGDRLASGWSPPDPNPVPLPDDAVKVESGSADGVSWSVYAYQGSMHAVVWAGDGGLALAYAPAKPADAQAAQRLVDTGRALLTSG